MKWLSLIIVSTLILAGCENNTTSPYDISSDPELIDPVEGEPDLFDYEADAAYMGAPIAGLQGFTAIWRDLVRPFQNTWIIEQLGPGLFEVTRTAVITGILHVQWEDSTITDKAFTCDGVKHSIVSRPARGTPGVLQQISPTLITTAGGQMAITRVEIVAASGTTAIEDPLELMEFPGGLVHLDPMEPVTIRVWGPPQDAIVVLRVPATLSDFSSFVMTFQGDHFEGQWHAPQYAGLRRVGIDVLSHATIYDAGAAYDGTAWLFPYIVR
ncbi:MAG: hypothetical protein MUE60_02995 [Candidatus Eisenbacteria bacterium]|jgi:hypothetical protein|nr:hypothetical protein [Candidatus Eisenbacteria bacterium]